MSSSDGGEEEEEDEEEEEEREETPKIVLPDRATRGKRMQNLIEEEDDADQEFWNQDFFQEEVADDEYKTESSSEDVVDTDFSEEEDEEDEEEADDGEEKKRRKGLQAPGAKNRGLKKPPQPAKKKPSERTGLSAAEVPSADGEVAATSSLPGRRQEYFDRPKEAPTLRVSTLQRVTDAEKERQQIEAAKPKRKRVEQEYRAPTQEELLAEAAETEILNLKDLATMVAQEEEVKKKSEVVKLRHSGPLVRFHSFTTPKHESVVTFELVHGANPLYLRPRYAPPAKQPEQCVITGLPAKYRDPLTKAPYANAEAFKEIRQRTEEGRSIFGKRPLKRRFDH
eukprot:jgi/Botrbrau1/4498/Bobra.0220s0031.1